MSTNWDLIDEISDSFLNNEDEITNKELTDKELTDKELTECKYCGSKELEEIDNERIECTDCGAINKCLSNYTKELRYYGSNDNKRTSDPNRCGMPLNQLFSQNTLCTSIIGRNNDILRKYNNYNGISYKERKGL